jgi:hypothetical protein
MPLFFYLPLIIWMGLFEVAQNEMRSPVKSGRYPILDNHITEARSAIPIANHVTPVTCGMRARS